MTLSQIFTASHQMTRASIARWHGDYGVTFSAALRIVYQVRDMSNRGYSLEALLAVGGKEWKKDAMHRVYFNDLPDLFGLKTSHYNTGNVSSASIDGQSISNARAREISSSLAMSKVWYDLADQEFHFRVHGCRTYDGATMGTAIVAEIKARLARAQEAA